MARLLNRATQGNKRDMHLKSSLLYKHSKKYKKILRKTLWIDTYSCCFVAERLLDQKFQFPKLVQRSFPLKESRSETKHQHSAGLSIRFQVAGDMKLVAGGTKRQAGGGGGSEAYPPKKILK